VIGEKGAEGRLWKRASLQGKGRDAPAAALIAAEWTSTGELRRRRGGGEEGGGARGEGGGAARVTPGMMRGPFSQSVKDLIFANWYAQLGRFTIKNLTCAILGVRVLNSSLTYF